MRYVKFEVASHGKDRSRVHLYCDGEGPTVYRWPVPPEDQSLRGIVKQLIAFCREHLVTEIRYRPQGIGAALGPILRDLWDGDASPV